MNKKEVLRKAKGNDDMTVEEIVAYQQMVKPKAHIYGKYGNLAKIYLEEHNTAKLWKLAGELPKYLHGIDEQAGKLYNTMYEKLSKDERFKKTGDFQKDLQIETEKKRIIEEEVLNTLVYVN